MVRWKRVKTGDVGIKLYTGGEPIRVKLQHCVCINSDDNNVYWEWMDAEVADYYQPDEETTSC